MSSMKPYAIVFSRRDKSKKDHPSMVILVTPEKITAYGLPGLSAIVVDSMNDEFSKLDASGVRAASADLMERYKTGGDGYGSAITFLDYGTNKLMIEDSIKELLDQRIDAFRKRS